ncbi:hypothetical protein [Clostridium sp.]|jgi:HSP20 family molecular chaperone IbpA|uniref:hypothetical protein n=1 Tax=Clostridium sp. TaxID=1506 RepID=UPI002FDDB1EE
MSNSITKYKDFNTVDEILNKWFNKSNNLTDDCGSKDIYPSRWEEAPNGYKAVCRTVGIRPEDVSVVLKNDYVQVSGKSVVDSHDYSVSCNLPIGLKMRDRIESIDYRAQDGITIIYLNVKKESKEGINIRRI